jgi:predicted deacylase
MRLGFPTGLCYIHLQESSLSGPPSLPQLCDRNRIPNITVELQTQRVFNRNSIVEGTRLLRNMLTFLGMIDGKLELPEKMFVFDPWGVTRPKSFRGKTYVEICAKHDGVVVPHLISQERIRKGELVCEVVDPHTGRVIQSVRAPKAGYLHMVLDYEPVVKKGQRLCLIALITRVINPAKAVSRLRAEDFLLAKAPA